MAKLACFEQERRAFQPKDLLNPLPLLAEPIIEVRTTGDLSMFQPSMGFVPGFRLLPSSPIRRTILKQVSDIFFPCRLLVRCAPTILAAPPMPSLPHTPSRI